MEDSHTSDPQTEDPQTEDSQTEDPQTEAPQTEDSQTFARHEYAQRDFWNSRFTEYKSAFDWYVGWGEMKTLITTSFPQDSTDNVLMVGCGNSSIIYSELSDQMQKNGYYITNIDISNVVLEQMRAKSRQDYLLMDATNTCFRDRIFDVLIDKGTFDALAVCFI